MCAFLINSKLFVTFIQIVSFQFLWNVMCYGWQHCEFFLRPAGGCSEEEFQQHDGWSSWAFFITTEWIVSIESNDKMCSSRPHSIFVDWSAIGCIANEGGGPKESGWLAGELKYQYRFQTKWRFMQLRNSVSLKRQNNKDTNS